MNVANTITFLRLLFVIPFAISLSSKAYSVTLFIFAFAGLSDLADGYIARKFNQKTKLGAFLDPFTDKIFIFTGNIVLLTIGALPIWFFALVSFKDLSSLLATIILSIKKVEWEPKPNIYGKIAVFLQVIVILLAILNLGFFKINTIFTYVIYICSIFTLISWILYFRDFFKLLK